MTELAGIYLKKSERLPDNASDISSILSIHFLKSQTDTKISGNMLGIGELCEQNIACMALCLSHDEQAISINPFDQPSADPESMRKRLRSVDCDDGVQIIRARSEEIHISEFRRNMPVRFIQLGASRLRNDVVHALGIAEDILSSDGLLAVDKFLDPLNLEITEALFDFKLENSYADLFPVGFCSNTIFFSRRKSARYYRMLFYDFPIKHHEYCASINIIDRASFLFGEEMPIIR